MSDAEPEENFCFYGRPLDAYEEDEFPKKKPVSIEDQIATDEHGRRRFHGAFTGGFSAGFFNTVGSLEGWLPTEFKSSRSEKAAAIVQKAGDFMDAEDIGEHGIAPQTIRATTEYSTSKKRKRKVFAEGPIPGEPVLETLLVSGNETVGYLLLKNMGISDKINKRKEELNDGKIYGCEMPKQEDMSKDIEENQFEIPVIYKDYIKNSKCNTFGLGYEGLHKIHSNLSKPSNLVMTERNNKKISITGQAFGVGAFEDEDDDIYAREDMSNYDFELTKEKPPNTASENNTEMIYKIFKRSTNSLLKKHSYPPPTIPHSFSGIHKVKKSRFEPIEIKSEPEEIDRSEINPAIRAKYLGEISNETYTVSKPIVNMHIETEPGNSSTFKETANKSSNPLPDLISDKFVSASREEDVNNILEPVQKSEIIHGTQQMRDAAKFKMFGPLTRISTDWFPCAVLCKRFNVPEPLVDRPEDKNKKRTKNLIFENQKLAEEVPAFKPGVSEQTPFLDESKPKITEEVSLPSKHEEDIPQQEQAEVTEERTSQGNQVNPVFDITEKIGIEDKTDLFKAIFLSSDSEDEEEERKPEKTESGNNIDEFKSTILSDDLIPKIKPLKQGILSNINLSELFIPAKDNDDSENVKLDVSVTVPQTNSYGPALPTQKMNVTKDNLQYSSKYSDDDDWVEKDNMDQDTISPSKKKKKKQKHKKHKHEKKSKK